MLRRLAVVLASAAFVGVFAGPAWAAEVTITDDGVEPPSVQADVGETILWTNDSSASVELRSGDPEWTSGRLQPGESFSLAFEQAGTYRYTSRNGGLSGEVVVVARGGEDADDPFDPQAAPEDTPDGASLPATGMSGAAVAAAAVLMSAGALALASTRRRA